MKTPLLILVLMTLSTFSYSQSRGDLKGPAAKNYKPWKNEDTSDSKVIYTYARTAQLQGPQAKNYKPWKNKNRVYSTIQFDEKKPKLMGPAAKNRKH